MARSRKERVAKRVKLSTKEQSQDDANRVPTTVATIASGLKWCETTLLLAGYAARVGVRVTLGKPTMCGKATHYRRSLQRTGRATFVEAMKDLFQNNFLNPLPPAGICGGWGQNCGARAPRYPDCSSPAPRAGQAKIAMAQKRHGINATAQKPEPVNSFPKPARVVALFAR